MQQNLFKLGGWAFAISGVVAGIGMAAHPPRNQAGMVSTAWLLDHTVILLALLVVIPTLPLLYIRSQGSPGWLRKGGITMAYLAHASFLGVTFFELFLLPMVATENPELVAGGLAKVGSLAAVLPPTGLAYVVGFAMLGVALTKAGIVSRLATTALTLGAAGVAFGSILPPAAGIAGGLIFSLGTGWVGWRLATVPGESGVHSSSIDVPAATLAR